MKPARLSSSLGLGTDLKVYVIKQQEEEGRYTPPQAISIVSPLTWEWFLHTGSFEQRGRTRTKGLLWHFRAVQEILLQPQGEREPWSPSSSSSSRSRCVKSGGGVFGGWRVCRLWSLGQGNVGGGSGEMNGGKRSLWPCARSSNFPIMQLSLSLNPVFSARSPHMLLANGNMHSGPLPSRGA